MSTPVLTNTLHAPASTAPATAYSKPGTIRPSANFSPSIWGNFLSTLSSNEGPGDGTAEQQIEELKSEMRRKLAEIADSPSQLVKMVDAVQRLGLAYHFQEEIEEALEKIYNVYRNEKEDADYNLYHVSLRFRLLRQQGYRVSSDVFIKFKDCNGEFREALTSDVQGILSLYEAAQLRVHGEVILDEANVFAYCHLHSIVNQLSSALRSEVLDALKQPIHKDVPRLRARKYLFTYAEDRSHDAHLHKLAKLDFNVLQNAHRRELSQLAKWWTKLDITAKLPFARDRMVESYFWALSTYFEPQYHLARKILSKVTTMITLMDDIYDVYATQEELLLLTEAISRWDMSLSGQMPEYMKEFYKALLNVYVEIEEEMAKQGRSYRSFYAKEAMKIQAKSYFEESKWRDDDYVPTIEEYMQRASVSSASSVLTITSFMGMGDIVTKESFEWIFSVPKIVKASEYAPRLMNDLVSHKFEQERKHIASAVECYMKQYNVSEQEACEALHKQIEDAWKDINEAFLKPTTVPVPVLMRSLNLTRVANVVYEEGDGFTHPHIYLKDKISSLLIDPVII